MQLRLHFHDNRSLVTVGSDKDLGGWDRCGAGRCVRREGVRSRAAGRCVRRGVGDVGSCGDSVGRFGVGGRDIRMADLHRFTHARKRGGVQ